MWSRSRRWAFAEAGGASGNAAERGFPPFLQKNGSVAGAILSSGNQRRAFVAKIRSFATFHLMRKIRWIIVAYIVLQKRATPWTSDTPV
jgi:hypothetical protein